MTPATSNSRNDPTDDPTDNPIDAAIDGPTVGAGADDNAHGEEASAWVVHLDDPNMAIVTSELTKNYFERPALAPLDLAVSMGERLSLIGHNGSGKTTLLQMLSGLLEPTAGEAAILGNPVNSIEARAAVSYLSDRPVFYDDLSVWEHLEYIARLHSAEEWEQHAVDLLDAVGLHDRVDDLPLTFSRGLRQKAAIALAFVRPFEVLLIDEPFVGLDRTGREALLGLITAAHNDGATIVVATHELSTVGASDRVVALRDGDVVFDGPPDRADLVMLTEGGPGFVNDE